jgi:hypothetical protein
LASDRGATIVSMWEIAVVCSDPECAEEALVLAAEIDEVEREVCASCEACLVLTSVATFEPVRPRRQSPSRWRRSTGSNSSPRVRSGRSRRSPSLSKA